MAGGPQSSHWLLGGNRSEEDARLHEEPEFPEMKGRMDSLAYQHLGHEVWSPTSSTPACVPVTSAPSDKGR